MSEREPITAELRELMGGVEPRVDEDGVVTAKYVTPEAWGEFVRRCDEIDAVHAQLERENAELRQRVEELGSGGGSMHDGGSITDELREYFGKSKGMFTDHVLAIADRIDAEHESACAEAYGNGVMSVPIALDESQWAKLPVDADGETIHIGDVMENIVCPSVHREVTGVGVECFYGWDDGNGRYSQFDANRYRHHHAPTVEDVLTEFAAKLMERGELTNGGAQTIAEYAAKLRLAGDAE